MLICTAIWCPQICQQSIGTSIHHVACNSVRPQPWTCGLSLTSTGAHPSLPPFSCLPRLVKVVLKPPAGPSFCSLISTGVVGQGWLTLFPFIYTPDAEEEVFGQQGSFWSQTALLFPLVCVAHLLSAWSPGLLPDNVVCHPLASWLGLFLVLLASWLGLYLDSLTQVGTLFSERPLWPGCPWPSLASKLKSGTGILFWYRSIIIMSGMVYSKDPYPCCWCSDTYMLHTIKELGYQNWD